MDAWLVVLCFIILIFIAIFLGLQGARRSTTGSRVKKRAHSSLIMPRQLVDALCAHFGLASHAIHADLPQKLHEQVSLLLVPEGAQAVAEAAKICARDVPANKITVFALIAQEYAPLFREIVRESRILNHTQEYTDVICEKQGAHHSCCATLFVLTPQDAPRMTDKQRELLRESDFPYRRLYMPEFEIMYERLRALARAWPKQWREARGACNLGIVTRTFPDDYENADSLTDHFAEPARILCREKSDPCPARIWDTIRASCPRHISADGVIDKRIARMNRESVYARARGCNLFNTALASYICARFLEGSHTRRILDCTAGWGDRLIGAHVADAHEYVGWDTNPNLQSVYAAIGAACKRASSSSALAQWRVNCAPFESARAEFEGALNQYFDLVLVCPPFFEQEMYTGALTSTTIHNTYERWLAEFFAVLLRNAYNAARKGAHIVSYLSRDLACWAIAFFKREYRDDVTYLGALGFQQKIVAHDGAPITRIANVWMRTN